MQDNSTTETRPIDFIAIGTRHRRDMGDIATLAASIATIGLLHPVVITPDSRLIAGCRRLAACKLLGWVDVPVRVVDLAEIARGEYDENVVRKDFLPSEAVAIARAVEPAVATPRGRPSAMEKVESFHHSENADKGKTRDKAAAYAGMSGRTLEKAAAVVDAAEREPERYGELSARMDQTGRVDGAYKDLKRAQQQAAKAAIPPDIPPTSDRYRLIHGDFRTANIETGSADIIITDPPYSREFLPLYGDLATFAARILEPGGSCLVMVGQSYLPEVLALMVPHIRYHWTLAYLTPGGQAVQLFERKVNTFWKPVLWFVNGDYSGDWIGDVARSAVNDNDKRFHDWGQSESGMADLVERFTYPGQTILDPFLGGGTTGVIAVQMKRLFVGIDVDETAIATSAARMRGL